MQSGTPKPDVVHIAENALTKKAQKQMTELDTAAAGRLPLHLQNLTSEPERFILDQIR
jgi:hypothetical protein